MELWNPGTLEPWNFKTTTCGEFYCVIYVFYVPIVVKKPYPDALHLPYCRPYGT